MTTGGDNGDGQDGGQQLLAIFWYDYYNTETSWLPLLLPFCGWCGLWVYATVHGKAYGKWWQIQLIHHVGAILGGSLSLYYDDDTLFNERNSILWSTAYFLVDLLDCLLTGHLAYIVHAVCCLLLGYGNYTLPLLRSLRMNSQATYIELSGLLLPYVKQYKKAWLFILFAVVFTGCRIIWIPLLAQQLVHHEKEEGGLAYTHPVMLAMGVFYCLNLYWYVGILRIIMTGNADGGNIKKTKKTQ